jgi:HEPN domain-containing protein
MRPPEEEIRRLVTEWIKKADLDLKTAVRLSAEGEFRDVVAFHAQQAVEKYLKALLTRHQLEFPKTHVIRRLLILLESVDPAMVEALDEANWLSPFASLDRFRFRRDPGGVGRNPPAGMFSRANCLVAILYAAIRGLLARSLSAQGRYVLGSGLL